MSINGKKFHKKLRSKFSLTAILTIDFSFGNLQQIIVYKNEKPIKHIISPNLICEIIYTILIL